jgi:hypothetical protein
VTTTPDEDDRKANELVATGAVFIILSAYPGVTVDIDPDDGSLIVRLDFLMAPYRLTVHQKMPDEAPG